MKKIITLLITAAMVLSVCAMPAMAETVTAKIADFSENIENVADETSFSGFDNDKSTSNLYYTYADSVNFLKINADNTYRSAKVTTVDNQKVGAVTFSPSTSDTTFAVEFLVLDSAYNRKDDALSLRQSNSVFTFRVKMPEENIRLDISTKGQVSNATTVSSASSDFYETRILRAYGDRADYYVYTETKDEKPTNAYDTVKNGYEMNEWMDFKIIYNYQNGTYDVYVNNKLIAENKELAGSRFLSNFKFALVQPKAVKTTNTVYIDDIKFYTIADADIEVQPNVSKTGNGTVEVTAPDTVVKVDDNVTYTVTPDNGSYIENATYGGEPIPAFDAAGVTLSDKTADGKKLEVTFKDYVAESPALMVSPFKFKNGTSTYLFMKLLANSLEISEYGMVMSATEEVPTAENAEVVTFDKTAYLGYYGYEVVNQTDVENQSFYVRPYAKVGDNYIYGAVSFIEPANIN